MALIESGTQTTVAVKRQEAYTAYREVTDHVPVTVVGKIRSIKVLKDASAVHGPTLDLARAKNIVDRLLIMGYQLVEVGQPMEAWEAELLAQGEKRAASQEDQHRFRAE